MASAAAISSGEIVSERARVEQHPDRHEEQHRERVSHGQRVGRRAEAELGSADDHAGEEGAERHRHAEELRRPDGDAERQGEHRQREQLARVGRAIRVSSQGMIAAADEHDDADEQRRP